MWESWHWDGEEYLTPLNNKVQWEVVCPLSMSDIVSCSLLLSFSSSPSWSPASSSVLQDPSHNAKAGWWGKAKLFPLASLFLLLCSFFFYLFPHGKESMLWIFLRHLSWSCLREKGRRDKTDKIWKLLQRWNQEGNYYTKNAAEWIEG